ncbi:MAG: coproporphyrinogen III oxidase, partial [Cetobacterium sp.]
VIRVGLQPSDDLREDGNVIAGPFHPAFREIIEGEIYYSFLKRILESEEKLEVRVNEKNVSRIVGINKINRVRLGRIFEIKIDNSFELNEIQVNEKTYFRKEILEGELNEPDNNKHR